MRVTQLQWGVKESFRRYVEAAGGKIEVLDGAERAADGTFVFPAAPSSDLRLGAGGKPEGAGAFLGQVRFEAHGGMLSVKLVAPALEIGPSEMVLSVADERGDRLPIAKLDISSTNAEDGGLAVPAKVTLDGMYLLGDHYPPGTVLDPVRLSAS